MSDIVERLCLLVPSDSSGAAFDAVNEITRLTSEAAWARGAAEQAERQIEEAHKAIPAHCWRDPPKGRAWTIGEAITRLTAEVERLNKSRNKWGQKYNKLLEKHKVTLSQLKTAVWSDSEECKLLTAEVERLLSVTVVQETLIRKAEAESEKLRAALELFECDCKGKELCAQPDYCVNYTARAALEEKQDADKA